MVVFGMGLAKSAEAAAADAAAETRQLRDAIER
jgi:hypothetical protein